MFRPAESRFSGITEDLMNLALLVPLNAVVKILENPA
jgi:hypothetical protein